MLVQGFFYQDQLNPVTELDGSGQVVSRFVYGTRPHVPDYMIRGGAIYRIVTDHLGSVRLVVNASTGAIAQRIDYDAFGRVTQNSNPGVQAVRVRGRVHGRPHRAGTLRRSRLRCIHGAVDGKGPDSIRGGSSNLYGYALDDPVNLLDVDGQAPIVIQPVLAKLLGPAAVSGFVGGTVEGIRAYLNCSSVGRAALGGSLGGFTGGAIGKLATGGRVAKASIGAVAGLADTMISSLVGGSGVPAGSDALVGVGVGAVTTSIDLPFMTNAGTRRGVSAFGRFAAEAVTASSLQEALGLLKNLRLPDFNRSCPCE